MRGGPEPIPVPLIVGPTAVGKTEVSILVAERLRAEIISADSRQVYRYMDIGTAKPSAEERRRVPHHMIDIVDPDVDYNAGDYGREAGLAIEEVRGRGLVPLVVGGSGLYVRALVEGFCPGPRADEGLRERLRKEAERDGTVRLHERLARVDPGAAAKIHPNDEQRLVRALEVYELTGRRLSDLQQKGREERAVTQMPVGLERKRSDLYRRIGERVRGMLLRGLVEEVRGLIARGYGAELNSMRALGYREIIRHLEGELSLEEAVALLVRNTKAFARRQMTWFRAMPDVEWIELEEGGDAGSGADRVAASLEARMRKA
jgi:tRNA dimethylallyltransferase